MSTVVTNPDGVCAKNVFRGRNILFFSPFSKATALKMSHKQKHFKEYFRATFQFIFSQKGTTSKSVLLSLPQASHMGLQSDYDQWPFIVLIGKLGALKSNAWKNKPLWSLNRVWTKTSHLPSSPHYLLLLIRLDQQQKTFQMNWSSPEKTVNQRINVLINGGL